MQCQNTVPCQQQTFTQTDSAKKSWKRTSFEKVGGVLTLMFVLSGLASAKTIQVSDYGITPGKDVTLPVLRLLDLVKDEPDVTLVFSKGQYDFHPDNAREQYLAVSNHDNGIKRIAFRISHSQNLTIDGGGALFMFHGYMIPFNVEESKNVTLKNLQIDWSRSFHDELTVVESNAEKKSFVVEIDPEHSPYKIRGNKLFFLRYGAETPMGMNIVFDPKTGGPIFEARAYKADAEKMIASEAGPNRVKLENGSRQVPPVGSVFVSYGDNPTSRLSPAIHVANSKDVKVENVTIYDAGGMGLIVERTENVTVDGLVVTAGKGRLAATRADATHFVGCKGVILEQNCRLENMLDDGINVHGAYVKVNDYLGDNQFLCEISHPQQWGLTFAEPGDRVALISRETLLPFFETSVKAVDVLNEQCFLLTLEATPEQLPKGPLSVENLTWYPDLVMKNNTVRRNQARGALVSTKGKVLIENNRFSSDMGGVLIEGDNNKWFESGGVKDVTIRNNVFDHTGFGGKNYYPLKASPKLTGEQRMGEDYYHRNIRFTGNTIKSFNGLVAAADSVKGLEISDNQIEFSKDYPADLGSPAIKLDYCDEVVIRNNQATGFEKPLVISISPSSTQITEESNTGFKSKKATSIAPKS